MAITMAVRELSDAELISGARKGDSDSYGELYRRHVDGARAAARALTRSRSDADDVTSEAFARVLRALQSGGGPDVSFRPYLVTAVRNVFYDKVRRNREEPTSDLSDEVNVALLDSAKSQEDGAFAATAFATLPERWQLVLWHTEVEGRSVAEVAPLLGLAPNAVAALAYRAREGLRQAYLQAHLHDQQAAECRDCAASLGAYVRDGLSARDRRRVDAHLDGCSSCKGLVAELADTNNTLRAALIPALIGVSSAAYLSGLGGKGLLVWFTRMPKRQQAATAAAAAAVLMMLALLAGALGGSDDPAALPAGTTVAAPSDGGGGTGDGSGGDASAPVTPPTDSEPPTDTATPPVTTVATTTTVPASPAPPAIAPGTTIARTAPSVPRATTPTVAPPATGSTATTAPATTAPATVPATTAPATTVPATTTTAAPVPASISATAVQRTAALANGQVRIEVTVSNTGASAAPGVQLDVPAPVGSSFLHFEGLPSPAATFVHAYAPGWSCTGNVSCTLPSLPAGQSSVLLLTFAVSPSAPATLTLTPGISKPVGAIVTTAPITIPVASVPGLLAAETVRGAVQAIGNSVTTCTDADPQCPDARNGVGTTLNHNSYAMQYVNTAGGTFNSSSAQLALTGSVSRAFLVWGGDVDQGGSAPDPAAKHSVSFTGPSGTTPVVADDMLVETDGRYTAYAEVTSLVSGSGTYSVADIQTALGTASFGGWSLVVLEHDASLPERFLLVAAPIKAITTTDSVSFSVDLLHTMSNASATLVAVGFEAERTLTGDSATLGSFTVPNAFRGVMPGTRDPAYDNTLGTDLLVAQATGLNGSQLAFNAATTNDRVIVALVAIALDL